MVDAAKDNRNSCNGLSGKASSSPTASSICWLLIAIQILLAAIIATQYSCTVDEAGHIPAGLAIWYEGDVSLYSVNPPLPRAVATIPLLFDNRVSLAALTLPRTGSRPEFEIARAFCATNSHCLHSLVVICRLTNLIWLLIASVVLKLFAKEVYGDRGAVAVISLWVSQPLVTSHGALVTADIAGTAMVIIVTFLMWKLMVSREQTTYRDYLVIGFSVGLAILTKYTNLILLPIALLIILRKSYHMQGDRRLKGLPSIAFSVALSCMAMIWSGFGFLGIGDTFDDLELKSRSGHAVTNAFSQPILSTIPIPFPPAMIKGIDIQQLDFENGRKSYLRGHGHRIKIRLRTVVFRGSRCSSLPFFASA